MFHPKTTLGCCITTQCYCASRKLKFVVVPVPIPPHLHPPRFYLTMSIVFCEIGPVSDPSPLSSSGSEASFSVALSSLCAPGLFTGATDWARYMRSSATQSEAIAPGAAGDVPRTASFSASPSSWFDGWEWSFYEYQFSSIGRFWCNGSRSTLFEFYLPAVPVDLPFAAREPKYG